MSTVKRKTSVKAQIPKPGDASFQLENYPLYNLNRTSATYIDEMSQAMKEVGYDQTVWRILMLLDDQNPSPVGELAHKSVTKMSTITRMLTRMEREGLVQRDCQVDDRRIILISMTSKGRKVLSEMKLLGALVYERAFDGINGKDIQTFTRILKQIRTNLSRSPYALKKGRC